MIQLHSFTIMKLILLSFLLFSLSGSAQVSDKYTNVKIVKSENSFHLLVNNRPYFIKGAVGSDYLEKLKQYGGNSIRTGSSATVPSWIKHNHSI